MSLARSTNGLWVNEIYDVNQMINHVLDMLKEAKVVLENDDIVFVSGVMDKEIKS